MTDSILDTVKKLIGVDVDNDAFDTDLIISINSILSVVRQLGVNTQVETISDKMTTWSELIPPTSGYDIEELKTYIVLRVRMLFDPPTSSGISTAIQEQIKELEWRINFEVDPHTAQEITTGGAEPP